MKETLLEKAREAAPGVPNAARAAQHKKNPEDVLLTSQQRDWLVNHLSKEYWGLLSADQQQRYIAGEPVLDCPFLDGDATIRQVLLDKTTMIFPHNFVWGSCF